MFDDLTPDEPDIDPRDIDAILYRQEIDAENFEQDQAEGEISAD